MADPINDGGPAFPRTASVETTYDHKGRENGSATWEAQDGMTLRDYFAAKAMHAELNTSGQNLNAAEALITAAERHGQTIEQRMAFNAYRMADAMLAERKVEWSESEREAMR